MTYEITSSRLSGLQNFRSPFRPTMDNFDVAVNGQPGATNAGQGQGATGPTPLGNSAVGFVVDNTDLGTTQTALRKSGIQPAAFHEAGAAAAAGAHTMAPTAPLWQHPGLGLTPELLNAVMVMGMPGGRGNSTKIPSPRMDPGERPTDPGRRN